MPRLDSITVHIDEPMFVQGVSRLRSVEDAMGVMEILCITALALGCNILDACFCYAVICLHRMTSIFAKISDRSR